mgnify:CR=1 FL=1
MVNPEQQTYLPAEIGGWNNPDLRKRYPDNWIHIIGRAVLGFYMRNYHRLDIQFDPEMPKTGPALFYTSHDSLLTTVALMVADPFYPWTIVPVKEIFFKIPGVSNVMEAWDALPLGRDGKDKKPLDRMLNSLAIGRTVCIAGEGTRSRDGILQPLDSSFVGLALICAGKGYPVVPLVEPGTYKAMPPGRWIPKPEQIFVRGGKPVDLSPWVFQRKEAATRKAKLQAYIGAAQCMQDQLAALLPEWQRPKPGSKPMWDREEYLKNKTPFKQKLIDMLSKRG